MRPQTHNTVLVWRGPSRADGAEIGVFLCWRVDNRKTGDVPTVYILRLDTPPVEALNQTTR